MKLRDLLQVLHESLELSTADEIKYACKLIDLAENLTHSEAETLAAAYLQGPLGDGDVPSKAARDSLIEKGLITKTVVKGQDGFNACNLSGAWVHRLATRIRAPFAPPAPSAVPVQECKTSMGTSHP